MSGGPTQLPPSTSDQSSAPAGIWQRVRQHKMLEWGLGYLGAALAIAHGAELLGHTFAWPEVVQRLVMGLLIVGFPLALTIAWFHGHKGLQRVTAGELMVGSVLLIVGAILLIFLVRAPGERETRAGEHASHPAPAAAESSAISLAVLPFVNLSTDKDQEYFVDGLSEELLSQLAQIRGLRVVARTSSFAFKGRNEDLRVVAEKLGVNRLLEGSVRKAGNQLRITAELVNAADGSSMGSYNYDRRLDDVFKVQQDIAKDVAAALSIKLQGGETSRPTGGTENIAAYDKYLLARSLAGRFDGASALKARQLYREALEIDPRFALAWLGLHTTLYNLILLSAEDPQRADFADVARQEMVEASAKVASLAPDAWWTQAMESRQYMSEHRWLEAEHAARAALDTAPASEVDPLDAYADVMFAVGRMHEAIDFSERMRQLDPLSLEVSGKLQTALGLAGRFEEYRAEYARCKDLPGDHTIWDWWDMWFLWKHDKSDLASVETRLRAYLAHESLPMTLSHEMADTLHDPEAARAAIRRSLDDPANADGARIGVVALYASQYGEGDVVFPAIRRQFLEYRDIDFITLWAETEGGLRSDPRFKAIARDMKLADYWRATGNWGEFCRAEGTSGDFACQ